MDYNKIRKIADYYGYEEQSLQLIEEMAELTQAINKARRRGGPDPISAWQAIVEEMADVWIMMQQVTHLIGGSSELEIQIEQKVERQLQRIEEEVEGQLLVPVIYGVHGIHMHKEYKPYKWQVPENIVVEVGDLVRVPASGKMENVLVVGKGMLPKREAKKLKTVIGIVDLSEEYEVPDGE